MINRESDMLFPVSVNLPSVYTAAHFFCGIPIIRNITVKNLPEYLCAKLSLSLSAKCANKEILSFTFSSDCFDASDFISEGSDLALINLEKHKILPDADFMHSITVNTTARIQISLSIGDKTSSCVQDIRISPFGHVCPEMPPELLCTYVLPDCEFAIKAEKKLASHAKKISERHTKQAPKPLLYAEALACVMLSSKLTYSALHREMLDGDCIIRDPDSLTESNKRSVSQTEAALIYCSCAERCGLRPGIIFLRKGAGSVKVLISIGLGDYYAGSPVCESIAELRERILDKEIFVFDVLGLLGTEDTDFARNVTETTNLVLKSSSTLAFSVDVYTSRLCGVSSLRPYDGAVATDIYGGYESISDAVKRIDKNAMDISVYGFSPYRCTCLGLCSTDGILPFSSEHILFPLDDDIICTEPDSFLRISSFRPKNLPDIPRNITEQAIFDSRILGLTEKIHSASKKGGIYAYPSKYIFSGEKLSPERIRDEFLSDSQKLLDIVKADALHNGNTAIYAAAGIIRLTENGTSYYAPCAYVPCDIFFEDGLIKLIYGTGKTVFNRSLRSHIEETTGASFKVREEELMAERGTEFALEKDERIRELKIIFEILKGICEDYPDTLTFNTECFISVFDVSYTLMRDCLERAEGKRFERYIESGKYTVSDAASRFYGRFEATLPFEGSAKAGSAVKSAENNSIIISGVHGTGKKKIIGNIIARTALAGDNILVCSKYRESIHSLYETMKQAGLEELCLPVSKEPETKKQIASDIEKLQRAPEYYEASFEDSAILEHGLSLYADDIYSEFGFGYSLYDSINEYCRCDLECEASPIDLSMSVSDLSRDGASKLFEVSEKLTEKARWISDKCIKGNSDIYPYLKYLKYTTEIDRSFSELLYDTAEQLDILSDKSAFARSCLGIGELMLHDVRTLVFLGEFFELIMKSGIDFLPEELLSGSTYRSAKNIEKACDIIDELCFVNSHLSQVSDRIAAISCTELYTKWRDSENNPFIKNSISHEIKKHLPSKAKPSVKEIDEILEKLAKREELYKELSYISAEAGASLGILWMGENTDTERARRIASFALSADVCIKKLFRNVSENIAELESGITRLISTLSEDKSANADFVLAVGAFRKLSCENGGLFNKLSEILCIDLYELKFENGILAQNGFSKMLRDFRDTPEPLYKLHELNEIKKEATALGLYKAVEYIENNEVTSTTRTLIFKSIYFAFASYIINSKNHPVGVALFEKYLKFIQSYKREKTLARFNLISEHRRRFADYISDDDGKNELYALRESLADKRSSVQDILSKHSKLIKVMYSAIFASNSFAYRLSSYPGTLVLLDCEKTDAVEGLPLCANFDKCIFVSSPFEKIGSIMSSLPLGLPDFRLTRVLCEKNGHIASFTQSLYKDTHSLYCRERNSDSIRFVKCSGGLYDKNIRANKIEAVQVCETALSAAKEFGFENVGIIAMTPAQTAEIIGSLEILANKYADERIAGIPARYIGNMGDFTKDCIVLSVAFGKNIYSITRSFGITDDISLLHAGNPVCLSELLCTGKVLYVVSSAEPEDIMTDNLCKGAGAIAALLCFAKYLAVPSELSNSDAKHERSGIEEVIRREVKRKNSETAVRCSEGIVTFGNKAILYENGYVRDIYDRLVLPMQEAKARGYTVEFSDICGVISKKEPTINI